MLGYTNQFLTHDLKNEWSFQPFWRGISLVWDSECVSQVRRSRSAEEWHRYALDIQQSMEALRADDAQNDEDEASRYWDGRNSEGVLEYGFTLAKNETGTDRTAIRAEYDGVRALLSLWEAQREQGHADDPCIEAALLLFHAIATARDGDSALEHEQFRELKGLRDLDSARHDFEVYIHGRREEFVKARYLPPRENPVIDARLTVLEALKQSEMKKAQQAVADERRERSAKAEPQWRRSTRRSAMS